MRLGESGVVQGDTGAGQKARWNFLYYRHNQKQSVAAQGQLIGRRQGTASTVAHLLFYTNLSRLSSQSSQFPYFPFSFLPV